MNFKNRIMQRLDEIRFAKQTGGKTDERSLTLPVPKNILASVRGDEDALEQMLDFLDKNVLAKNGIRSWNLKGGPRAVNASKGMVEIYGVIPEIKVKDVEDAAKRINWKTWAPTGGKVDVPKMKKLADDIGDFLDTLNTNEAEEKFFVAAAKAIGVSPEDIKKTFTGGPINASDAWTKKVAGAANFDKKIRAIWGQK